MTGICKLNFDLLVYLKLGIINTGTVKRTFERDTGCLNSKHELPFIKQVHENLDFEQVFLMSKAKCRIFQRKRLFNFNDG